MLSQKVSNTVLKMRLLSITIGLFVLGLDTVTKVWVKGNLWLHYYPVIDGFFTIQYATNEGIAFGLFHTLQSQWKTPILSVMAVAAVLLVLYYIWTTPAQEKLIFCALGLLLGGILGNFIDRLGDQSVVDFLKVHWGAKFAWPTFNIADSAITSGVFLILAATILGLYGNSAEEHEATSE